MTLLALAVLIIVAGVLLWAAATTYIPMNPQIKQILVIVVILGVALVTLDAFGVFDAIRGVNVPRVGRG